MSSKPAWDGRLNRTGRLGWYLLLALLAVVPARVSATLAPADVTPTARGVAFRQESGMPLVEPTPVTVTIRNSSGSAQLRVDSIALTFSAGGQDLTAEYSVTGTPTLPATLNASQTQDLIFQVRPLTGTRIFEPVQVSATVTAHELPSGSPVVVGKASEWTVSPGAVQVLGQSDLTAREKYRRGLNGPWAVASDGTRLFVTEPAGNRVLVWNPLPTTNHEPPDLVLSQPDLAGIGITAYTASTLGSPYGVATDGSKLYISDSSADRVLIWNSLPAANMQAANVVVGQSNFTSTSSNAGGSRSQYGFYGPQGLSVSGSKLFVADTSNHRVLIWNSIPTDNGAAADVVLGQPNPLTNTANNGGVSASSLNGPSGVGTDGTKLFVADHYNSRVLVWNSVPSADAAPADVVLGQPSPLSNTANNGGLSASSLYRPQAVASDGRKLVVADGNNNRVLVWNRVPTSHGQAADGVLGQTSFAGNSAASRPSGVAVSPRDVAFVGGNLWVSESMERVLRFDAFPATGAALSLGAFTVPALVSQGQTFGATLAVTNVGGATADLTSTALTFSGTGLTAVADAANPVTLGAGAEATFRYAVTVAVGSTPGSRSASATVLARDADSGADVSVLDQALTGNVTVQLRATPAAGAFTVPASVSQGQTFSAGVVVTNTGQATAGITSTALTFSGSGVTAVPGGANPVTLAGGVSATFAYTVTAQADATPGARSASLTVLARDGNSGADVSLTDQALSGSVTVQTPPALAAGTFTVPAAVSQGQTFSAAVVVTNNGEATAGLTSTALTFSGSGVTAVAGGANPVTLAGGVSASFAYSVTAATGASPGSRTAILGIQARDVNTGADASVVDQALSGSVTVQLPAALSVVSVDAAPATVSRGQTGLAVTVAIRNAGEAGASIAGSGLTFTAGGSGVNADYVVTPGANPSAVAGGTTATFTYTVAVGVGATLGAVTLDATVTGSDANSGAALSDGSAEATDGWTVQIPATLAISSVQAVPAIVSRGQTGIEVTMLVRNPGEATASVGSVGLSFTAGGSGVNGDYGVTPGANPTAIAGGTTATFTFTVSVQLAATLGAVDLNGTVSGTDANSTAPLSDESADSPDAWTVQAAALLQIASVQAAPATVSRGQAGIAVTMLVRNAGQVAAGTVSAGLTFSRAGTDVGSDYTVTAGLSPTSIAGGATATFTWTVAVATGAALGSVTVDGLVSGVDAGNGAPLSDAGADAADSWTVQTPAVLAIASVGTGPVTVSRGQTGVAVTVAVRNAGEASANVDSSGLTFTAGGSGRWGHAGGGYAGCDRHGQRRQHGRGPFGRRGRCG